MQTPLGGIDTVKVVRKDGSTTEVKLKVIAIQGNPKPLTPAEVPAEVVTDQEGGE